MAIILTGTSGSGKSTLELALEKAGFDRVISYTTRAIRAGEKNGKNYHFITKEDFKARVEAGFFAEVGKHAGHFYGVAQKDISLNSVMVVNMTGLKQLKKSLATTTPYLSFYLDIPESVRVERMIGRGDAQEVIRERVDFEREHFKNAKAIVDHVLYSEDLQANLKVVLSAYENRLEEIALNKTLRQMAEAALR